MTGYEVYIFFLCLIVFTLLTAMFTYLIASITRAEISLIGYGHRDKEIIKEKQLNSNKALSVIILWSNRVLSILLCLLMIAAFSFAIYIRATEDRPANGIPSIKVVKSESMAKKHEKNTYLFENGLDDQFGMFDIVICSHLPAEEDLSLYDVVVYRVEDVYVIHRIVGIEEPNAQHPNERHFLLQGDAVDRADTFPVRYEQMQGIYRGVHIPYVGSFVLFLQSPAGWLCILLIVFSLIVTPIVEGRVTDAREKRYALIEPPKAEESEAEAEIVQAEEIEKTEEIEEIEEIEEADEPPLTPAERRRLRYATRGRLCEVGTGVLHEAYEAGARVDLPSLKGKGLVAAGYKRIKIIVRGEIDKPLAVYADACSEKARAAILRAGGSVELVLSHSAKKGAALPEEDGGAG